MSVMRKNIFGWLVAIIFCGVVFTLGSCTKMDAPSPFIDDPTDDGVVITDTTVLEYSLLGAKHEYVRVNYTYNSVDVDGVTPLKLSSALVFAKELFDRKSAKTVDNADGKEYDAKGLMLTPHFTIASAKEAPTKTNKMELEGPVCTIGQINEQNFILVSPDFSGFGITEDKPQAYMIADVAAKQALDALDAAKKALKKMSYTYGSKLALVGYSQGGHTAMAIQRYLSMTSVVQPFGITCAGGGPFDLAGMVDSMLKPDAKTKYPCAIPLIMVETAESMGLGLDYSKVFRQPLGEKMVKWIRSKQLTTTQINDSIAKVVGGKVSEGLNISDILNLDYAKRSNPALEDFFNVIEYNSLVGGWEPLTPSRYYFYHSEEDEVVPFFCYERMLDFMLPKASDDMVIEYDESSGQHVSAAAMFVVMMFAKIMAI